MVKVAVKLQDTSVCASHIKLIMGTCAASFQLITGSSRHTLKDKKGCPMPP